jgi:hypothetical protein
MAIKEVKRHKSPVIDQIPAELIKAGGSRICPEIHILINSVWNKEEYRDRWQAVVNTVMNLRVS